MLGLLVDLATITLPAGITASEVTSKAHDMRGPGEVLKQNHNYGDTTAYYSNVQLDDAVWIESTMDLSGIVIRQKRTSECRPEWTPIASLEPPCHVL